jgi:hypothetical protein
MNGEARDATFLTFTPLTAERITHFVLRRISFLRSIQPLIHSFVVEL